MQLCSWKNSLARLILTIVTACKSQNGGIRKFDLDCIGDKLTKENINDYRTRLKPISKAMEQAAEAAHTT